MHPAGPPESGGLAAATRHTSSHTHWSIQVRFSLPALPSPLASGGREAVAAVGGSAASPDSARSGSSDRRCYIDVVAPTVFSKYPE